MPRPCATRRPHHAEDSAKPQATLQGELAQGGGSSGPWCDRTNCCSCAPENDHEALRDLFLCFLREWSERQDAVLKKALDDIVEATSSTSAHVEALLISSSRRRMSVQRISAHRNQTVMPEFAAASMDAAQNEAQVDDEDSRGVATSWHSGKSDGLQSFSSERYSSKEEVQENSGASHHRASMISSWLSASVERRSTYLGTFFRAAWDFFENPESNWAATRFDRFFPAFILSTVCLTLVQLLVRSLMLNKYITIGELCIDVLFALELLIRFVSCPHRWSFFRSPYNLIDIAAALPLGPHLCKALDLMSKESLQIQDVRVLSFVPVLRILRTLRRFKEFHLLLEAFQKAFKVLPVVLYFYCVLLLFFGALVHAVEPLDNVESLSQALWLTVVSMTTVGYGDVSPVSEAGKCVIALLVITSTLYMAVPLGIIGNCFSEVWQDRERILLLHCLRTRFKQWGYSPHDIPAMFDHFDKDQDGVHDFAEFKNMVSALGIGMTEERCVQLFSKLDKSTDGFIDDSELVLALFPSVYYTMYDKDGTLKVPSSRSWYKHLSWSLTT